MIYSHIKNPSFFKHKILNQYILQDIKHSSKTKFNFLPALTLSSDLSDPPLYYKRDNLNVLVFKQNYAYFISDIKYKAVKFYINILIT